MPSACMHQLGSLHYDDDDSFLHPVPAPILELGAAGAALLCLHNAMEGGLSSWSSSISVHNEILRRRPDLARVLAGPWFMDRKACPVS